MVGLWLALSARPRRALLDPYIKAMNSMPRVILAPIFAVWFGLGIASKVALGVTLVFFIVFFNVYQGVKEVSPTVLANARMLGASERQLLRHVYLPSATSWVFSSLHNSVGLAFVGAVVGEYLGSARGVGYLILQAEGTFDINTVFAGILVLTAFALVLDWMRDAGRAAAAGLAAARRRDGEDLSMSGCSSAARSGVRCSRGGAGRTRRKPVRVVMPYPPGSTPDIVGRALAAGCRSRSASRSWSRTAPAPAATSAPRRCAQGAGRRLHAAGRHNGRGRDQQAPLQGRLPTTPERGPRADFNSSPRRRRCWW